MKLTVGFSKTLDLRADEARGASVQIEVELEPSVWRQPDRVREPIHALFELARRAVDEELGGASACTAPSVGQCGAPSEPDVANALDHPIVRPATEGQVKAIYGLAKRHGCNVGALMRDRFHVTRPEELSLPAASALIDELKKGEAG
jgi:hypothetical protein